MFASSWARGPKSASVGPKISTYRLVTVIIKITSVVVVLDLVLPGALLDGCPQEIETDCNHTARFTCIENNIVGLKGTISPDWIF